MIMDTRHYPTRAGARVRGGRPQPAPPAVLSGPQSSSSSKVLRLGFTAAAARTRGGEGETAKRCSMSWQASSSDVNVCAFSSTAPAPDA